MNKLLALVMISVRNRRNIKIIEGREEKGVVLCRKGKEGRHPACDIRRTGVLGAGLLEIDDQVRLDQVLIHG